MSDLNEAGDGRVYNSFPGSRYTIPSDEKERERLTTQHHFYKHLWGNKNIVLPELDFSHLQPGDKVLDSGTGTGIWALEVASEVPDYVSVHGIDISPHLFPASPPLNVHFSVRDISSDLPPDWSDSFSIVNQRLLFFALTHEQWDRGLREMFRILKPGGSVQLVEVDFQQCVVGPASQMYKDLTCGVCESLGLWTDCAGNLDDALEKHGFVNVKRINVPVEGEDGATMTRTVVRAAEAMRKGVIQLGGLGIIEPSDGVYDRFIEDLVKEWETVPGAKFIVRAFVGQKPI